MAELDAVRAAVAAHVPEYGAALDNARFRAAYRQPGYSLWRSLNDKTLAIAIQGVLIGKALIQLRTNSLGASLNTDSRTELAFEIAGEAFDALFDPAKHNQTVVMRNSLSAYLDTCVKHAIVQRARRAKRLIPFDPLRHGDAGSTNGPLLCDADRFFFALLALAGDDEVIFANSGARRLVELWRHEGGIAPRHIEGALTGLSKSQVKRARQFICKRAQAILRMRNADRR
jgi:hypothetical protein